MEEMPIIVSEIPPKRQSSGLSFLSKMGVRKDSGTSNSFLSSPNHSREFLQETMFTKKSFTQTFIEDWLVKTSSPSSSQKSVEDTELPPWASQRRQQESNILEEEDVCDSHSLDSITNIIEEAKQAAPIRQSSIDYSIMDNELLFPDDNDKLDETEERISSYTTPPDVFSPLSFLNDDDDDHSSTDSGLYRPHLDPEYFDIPFSTTSPHNDDVDNLTDLLVDRHSDSLDTAPYRSEIEDSLPDTIPYNSEEEAIPDTIPYKSDLDELTDTAPYQSDNEANLLDTLPYKEDDLPDTLPYDSNNEDDLPDTLPYNSSDDLPDTLPYNSDNDLPASLPFNSDNEDDLPDTTIFTSQETSGPPTLLDDHIPFDNTSMKQSPSGDNYETLTPIIASLRDPEDLLITNEQSKSPHASLDLRVATSQPSMCMEEDLDLFDTVTDEEIVQLVKRQSSSGSSNDGKRPASSPLLEPIPIVKKTTRTKKPTTIDDYFSLNTNDEIGKESQIPSYTISSNEDIKKHDTQSDHRRRPRLGISKRNFK